MPLYREPLRPQFHFTTRYWDACQLNPQAHQEGWINDVNGLVYLDGDGSYLAGEFDGARFLPGAVAAGCRRPPFPQVAGGAQT